MTKEVDMFDYLRSNVNDQMKDINDHISRGGCKDYPEYTKCCGIIQGLAQAEREILDAKSRYERAQ